MDSQILVQPLFLVACADGNYKSIWDHPTPRVLTEGKPGKETGGSTDSPWMLGSVVNP